MEVASLSVKLSADVEQAISGLHKSDAALQKSAIVANKESKKVEGFTNKMKMGWLGLTAAAIASLYAVAKSSAVIGGYFSEFGLLIGYVFDEIGMALEPVIVPLLDFLWILADKFAALPEVIKAATGALIAFGSIVLVVIPATKKLLAWLGFKGLLAKLAAIKAGFLGLSGIAGVAIGGIIGIAFGLGGVWVLVKTGILNSLDKIGRKFEGTHPIIMDFLKQIMLLPGIIGTVAIDIVTGRFGQIPEDVKKIFRDWQDANGRMADRFKSFITVTIPNAVRSGIAKIKAFNSKWYHVGSELVSRIIRGIGDIGGKIWNAIKSGLSSVAGKISDWASGILGLSPTLLEIGAKIPKTLMAGATNIPLNINRIINTHVATPITAGGGIGGSSTKQITINFNPRINITGEIKTDTDLRKLASDLSVFFKDEIKRMVRG